MKEANVDGLKQKKILTMAKCMMLVLERTVSMLGWVSLVAVHVFERNLED